MKRAYVSMAIFGATLLFCLNPLTAFAFGMGGGSLNAAAASAPAAPLAASPIPDFADSPDAPSADTDAGRAFALGAQAEDDIVWTSDDFTYGDYEKTLYGCDYARQFTVAGQVVTGFSEAGRAKLESGATDLVIPAKAPDGSLIVGIGEKAFYECGLTSVTFPTGMMVAYDDDVTKRVTKRGNFVIAESAFARNGLSELTLPAGVLAVLPNAFQLNKLERVVLPQTIWWIETMSFANNRIERVDFPTTTDFQLEMHGMAFGDNKIKSVRLPDFTEVVNKDTFAMNPGMEEAPDSYPSKAKIVENGYPCGVVYMYADNIDLSYKDRIHHIDQQTASTKSYTQKLVISDGTPATRNPDAGRWTVEDFTIEKTTITGLSESGIAKRSTNKNLVLPARNAEGQLITELASTANGYGLFGAEGEGFDSVELPSGLEAIGDRAFASNGIKDVTWPSRLKTIGLAAFQNNRLSSVVLPDTVTVLGGGAFATNATLERVGLSAGLTEIADGAFGCSDKDHWMTGFTSVEIPGGVTRIGGYAFAGNNFEHIDIPESVKEIGKYAFSTKNYLKTPCTLSLPEGLVTIGSCAFRNKIINSVILPTTLEKLEANTFHKAYSDDTEPMVTHVVVKTLAQFEDKVNFPGSETQTIHFAEDEHWCAADFTYGEMNLSSEDLQQAGDSSSKVKPVVHVVTGLSDQGESKLEWNTDVVIPDADPDGIDVCGVGPSALRNKGITSVAFPEGVLCPNDTSWDDSVTTRGNFFIGASAFYGNELAELELPEGTFAVMGSSFGKNRLEKVTLPSTLFYVGNQAFASNRIADIELPAATDFPLQVANMAFANNQLTALQIPSNTGYVAQYAFAGNPGMEPVADAANALEKQSGVVYLFAKEPSRLGRYVSCLSKDSSKVQDVKDGTVPGAGEPYDAGDFTYSGAAITGWSDTGKVKRLANHDLVLPDEAPDGTTITSIGPAAFRSPDSEVNYDEAKYDYSTKYGIKTLVLPAHLQSIGDDAFLYNELTSVPFADTPELRSIGQTAFKGNHILRLALPDSVGELGQGAFAANSIVDLTLPAGISEIPDGAFSMNIRLSSVAIPNSVVTIGDAAFAGARLTTLDIPASVTHIGRKAFHLHHLASLRVPGTVKTIGDNAFEGTYKAQTLKSLTLGEGIESIGAGAFKEGLLETVALPASLKTLGAEPFENNAGKDGSQVVELTTANADHLKFNQGAKTHRVVLVGGGKAAAAPAAEQANQGSQGKLLPQPLLVKAKKKTVTIKAGKLRKKAYTVKNIKTVVKGQGKVAFKNVSTNKKAKKFKVNAKTGAVKVTKKLKKGIYKVRVRVAAAGNGSYKAGSAVVAFKVKVK